jgi:methionine synthase I (cobalamin-dependent)
MDVDLSAPLLLDGALETNLFGDRAPESVCVERWILEHPEPFLKLVTEFKQMGSKVIHTPTAGASRPRLACFGLEREVKEYNRKLVELTRRAAGDLLISGRLSSTGLTLEPFGETSFTEMIEIFREQAAALVEAGVDFLTVEEVASISEARAAAIALKKFHKPVMITMDVDEDGDTVHGGSAVNALVILQELGIAAFGLNCCKGANKMSETIAQMRPYAKIPLIAKPSAYSFEEDTGELTELTPIEMAVEMKELLSAGARIVGGCCKTTPKHIEAIAVAIGEFLEEQEEPSPEEPEETTGDIILADTRQIYKLYCDQIEFSEPLSCTVDMTDELLQLEEESIDVILVEIDTVDDARDFALNAHMAKLPVCFLSHDEIALRLALLLYNGIAMVDSSSSIEPERLEKIAGKYGAVIY